MKNGEETKQVLHCEGKKSRKDSNVEFIYSSKLEHVVATA